MPGRIVVGVDGSEGSRQALRWAVEEARVRRAVVQAVAVWQGPYEFGDEPSRPADEVRIAKRASDRLAEAVAGAGAGAGAVVPIEELVLDGDPAEVLCKQADGAELLVVGSHGYGAFTRALLGSVSRKCVYHGTCPVAVVPTHDRRVDASGTGA